MAESYERARLEEYRRNFRSCDILPFGKAKDKGYCESCRTHQPAPKVRQKGWRCDNCKNKDA